LSDNSVPWVGDFILKILDSRATPTFSGVVEEGAEIPESPFDA